MKILIAEDDLFSRRLLEKTLQNAGHTLISCEDGNSAIKAFEEDRSIEFIILDWMMPGMSGLEVCKLVKENEESAHTYIIMLTAKNKTEDLVEALDIGADDFISKPFNALELNARINAGLRIISLQKELKDSILELQGALAHVEQLQGILPICAWCKKIRDDSQFWTSVEEYIGKHSEVKFSHSICPECFAEKYPDEDEEETESTNAKQGTV